MKNNVYTLVSYNNYELKLMVFSVYRNKPFLLFEEMIEKINLNLIKSDIEKDRIAIAIQNSLEKSKVVSKSITNDVYLIFDAEEYFYDAKTLSFEYPEKHVVIINDIQKIRNHAINSENARPGYNLVDFQVQSFAINGKKNVTNPIGMSVNSLNVSGELVYADSTTYYNLKSLLESYSMKIVGAKVGGYILKDAIDLEESNGIMEIGSEKINFVVNDKNNLKQFSIKIGFVKFWDSLYENLSQDYDELESESAVRFLMNYFPIQTYNTEAKISDNIKLDDLIQRFSFILVDYFKFIFNEIQKQKIDCSNYFVLMQDYPVDDFLGLLEENVNLKFNKIKLEEFKMIDSQNLKAFLAVKKFEEQNLI